MFSRNWPSALDLQALLTDAVDLPGTVVDVGDSDLQPSDELMTVLMSDVPDALTPNEADMPGEFPDLSEHTESLFGSVVPLPETPSEPPEYHLLEPFCSSLPPFQAYMTPHSHPGGDSSQNVFRFPELDDGESTTPFPTVPVSHEEVQAVFDTPPATPSTPQQGPPHPPPHRRERLGGVSMIRDEEFDFELDVPQEDMSVFPDTDSPAAKDAATAGSSLEGREEGQEQEDHMQLGGGEPAEEERLDPRLAKAWEQSQGSKSIAPLLKEELRLKIQKKRVDTGQEELVVRFNEPRVYQMTKEDHAKREIRRAQNRGAAQRFRQKKKQKEVEIRKRVEENEKKKQRLTLQVSQLRREAARLWDLLLQHRRCGDCRLLAALPHVPDVPVRPALGDLDGDLGLLRPR